MRIVEEKIYQFTELDDSAKETAREWWKDGIEFHWWKESLESVYAFCNHFDIKVKDYSIGAFSPSWLTHDAENHSFRGLKLKDIKRDYNPTGYCLDCTLWETFYDTWKETSDPLKAFNEAIDRAVIDIVKDIEYQYSDEAVDEMLIVNEYEFTEDGKRY